jgi:hypothetical protein
MKSSLVVWNLRLSSLQYICLAFGIQDDAFLVSSCGHNLSRFVV